ATKLRDVNRRIIPANIFFIALETRNTGQAGMCRLRHTNCAVPTNSSKASHYPTHIIVRHCSAAVRFGSKADIAATSNQCPLYPQKRTLAGNRDFWLMALVGVWINFFEVKGNFGILPGIYRQTRRLMASSMTQTFWSW